MVTFKAIIKQKRKDGLYNVYIRVTQQRQQALIKTEKAVSERGLRGREITDAYVLRYCSDLILKYNDRLNREDCSSWSAKEIAAFLTSGDADMSFSEYARGFIGKMFDRGEERNARNYELALHHFERFMGTTNVMFSYLTSHTINRWIDSMRDTHRAKEMYPICLRQVWKAAERELNDKERGIERVNSSPWGNVTIPKADTPQKLAISAADCRKLFACPIPESRYRQPLTELGRDVAMMVLCLAGINTIDLFGMRREDYHDGIIHYNRAKTKKFRRDGAYMEMRVPAIILPLFDKYRNTDAEDDHLFNFYQRHSTNDSFNANVNAGLQQLCEQLGIPKERKYSVYTFRHTWGTLARNAIGADMSDVAFAMNHSSAHRVTEGYVKQDYSRAWELNDKVVELVFFSDEEPEEMEEDEGSFRIAAKYLVKGGAYFMGRKLAEVENTGYNNIDEVIKELAGMLPSDIPQWSMVLFRIENVDRQQTAVYQRQKGKGF